MARLHLFLPPVDCVKQFKREIGVNDQVSRFYEGGPFADVRRNQVCRRDLEDGSDEEEN